MLAKAMINTLELPREEWLEYRRKGIGGSDAAAVAGLSPWKSPIEVWLEKTGQASEHEDNDAIRIGRDLEDYVAERFEEETGKRAWRVNQLLQHPDYPFMLANIDRRVVKEDALLECKTTVDYHDQWTFDSHSEGFPEFHQFQVQHYLAVTGYSTAYLAVLVLNKRKFWWYKIERDEEYIKPLIKLEADFWKLVEDEIPPEPDGSRACTEFLKERYAESNPGAKIVLPGESNNLIELRNSYKEQEKELKEKLNEVENQLKDQMGEAEIGLLNGEEVVTWKQINSRRVDSKRLQKELPDIYEEYSKESSYRRFVVK